MNYIVVCSNNNKNYRIRYLGINCNLKISLTRVCTPTISESSGGERSLPWLYCKVSQPILQCYSCEQFPGGCNWEYQTNSQTRWWTEYGTLLFWNWSTSSRSRKGPPRNTKFQKKTIGFLCRKIGFLCRNTHCGI